MPDATELVKTVKKTAVEAVDATKPVHICFGTVVSAAPIKINVEQKMELGAAQIVLTQNVTDYVTYRTLNNVKEKITIHNGLAAGDKVVLARQQEGQKYIVIGRIGV